MSIITVFNGTFCNEAGVLQRLIEATGAEQITDADVVASASRISGLDEEKLSKAFSPKTSIFNKFTHEKERSIAYLRLALAQVLERDNLLIHGFSSLLVGPDITHALRVCLIADMRFRLDNVAKTEGLHEKEAVRLIHRQDEERAIWVDTLFGKKDPWDASLYDIVLPMDKIGVDQTVSLVQENLAKDVVKTTSLSRKAVGDFRLAAEVEVALAKEGHNIAVRAEEGRIILTINKHTLLLSRLEEELGSIAERVPGVKSVETKVGEGFYQADIYRKYDFQVPAKVLLVDDEREFVQTLSERLLMRDMGSAIAYDGESALTLVEEEEPEVMILDLKMPGIDGIEVLRRVKETQPEIEVIILTGHGSEADRKVCMDLGAFAYLQKPVDIELLSDTLKHANEKIQKRKAQSGTQDS